MSDVIERQKDIVARHICGENEHDWLGTHCRALGKIGTKIISNRPYPEVAMRCLLVFTVVLFATVAATPQASPDETAVRNIIQEEITAWNSSDAAAYSRHFAADGTFTNIRGGFFSGRPICKSSTIEDTQETPRNPLGALGYEPTDNRNDNNLQDAGGPRKPL